MTDGFKKQLATYKQLIDADIAAYAGHVRRSTAEQYGEYPAIVTDAYLDMLSNGGKRIRGALAMVGYEMCGGTDRAMITRAATALEMVHAYILIIDDVQDRAVRRRGHATVHERLAVYHRSHRLRGDSAHAGMSLALNAALAGAHAAHMLIAGLSVAAELRMKAIGIVNHTMLITAHGQTLDIMNELVGEARPEDVAHAQEWKTAHYTVLNPLCVGMVLAGAECEDTNAIREYALHTGRAYQITDDIMGVFGNDEQTGKNGMDDIKEGKQTHLTMYAFAHASAADKAFLRRCLGNPKVTSKEYERIQYIMRTGGALAAAQQLAAWEAEQAKQALALHEGRWPKDSVAFLRSLADALLGRGA